MPGYVWSVVSHFGDPTQPMPVLPVPQMTGLVSETQPPAVYVLVQPPSQMPSTCVYADRALVNEPGFASQPPRGSGKSCPNAWTLAVVPSMNSTPGSAAAASGARAVTFVPDAPNTGFAPADSGAAPARCRYTPDVAPGHAAYTSVPLGLHVIGY